MENISFSPMLKSEGKLGRLAFLAQHFLLGYLLPMTVGILIAIVISEFVPPSYISSYNWAWVIIGIFVIVFMFYVMIITILKRMRDIGMDAVWLILWFIPFVSIGFYLYLIFKAGKSEQNSF